MVGDFGDLGLGVSVYGEVDGQSRPLHYRKPYAIKLYERGVWIVGATLVRPVDA